MVRRGQPWQQRDCTIEVKRRDRPPKLDTRPCASAARWCAFRLAGVQARPRPDRASWRPRRATGSPRRWPRAFPGWSGRDAKGARVTLCRSSSAPMVPRWGQTIFELPIEPREPAPAQILEPARGHVFAKEHLNSGNDRTRARPLPRSRPPAHEKVAQILKARPVRSAALCTAAGAGYAESPTPRRRTCTELRPS